MHLLLRRAAASLSLRVGLIRCAALTFIFVAAVLNARAVVVRGRLTDALGAPVAGGRVQLMRGRTVVAFAVAGTDGVFEVRSSESGRFALVGSSAGFLPSIGHDFYAGAVDVLEQDVVLSGKTVRQEVSVTATGIPTPLPQLTAPVSLVASDDLATRVGVADEMRQAPGLFVVQTGQDGGATSLFVRGGPSDGNKVLIDGVPANDVGGSFDFGTVSSTAVDVLETYRGPDSVLYGSDAESSVESFTTPRGSSRVPALTYSGDAGNLHTWRDEATVGGAFRKLDYYAAVSRFDTSNAVAHDRYHDMTSAANLGYELFPKTYLRGTIRNSNSATGLPGAHDFIGLSVDGKQADHDLYTEATLENTALTNWHNLVRYGVSRKLETAAYYEPVGTLVVFYPGTPYSYSEYFGNVVTIRGANGYTAKGQADIFNSNDSLRSNRDELYYQSDKTFTKHLTGLFGFRYEDERGDSIVPAYFENNKVERRNFEYTLQLQGDAFHRFFYSIGGAVVKNHFYGVAGTPRIGLAYVPVTPGRGYFHGTKLRATFAKGVHEPSVADQFASLYNELLTEGPAGAANIAKYHVHPLQETRSRTYDIGVDQNLVGDRVIFKLGYFHNQFDHQLDYIDSNTLLKDFGIPVGSAIYGGELNTLAYRAQGIETELEARAGSHWFFRGGYTYLDAVVEQSFSTDAAYNGTSTTNPNLPGVPIGSTYALVGARPFRRPPHTGFITANYTHRKLSLSVKTALASRSDDSTFLSYSDINGDNTLLLPNRNLDFGYVKLDVGGTYQVKSNIGVFAQVDNLLNDQHIGPIGFPGLPLTFRAGVKLRFFGDTGK